MTKPLAASAILPLVGLALMVWSLLQRTPLPVMLAMTVGQVIGTVAFAIFVTVIVRDLRQRLRKPEAPR
jgi:hypothetical protein